ncbi:distal tubule morphoproteinsis [Sparganum proliferum]
MQEQFRSLVYTDLFLRLPADTVLTLLRNDHLSVDSEEAVFEAISSWVRAGDKECDNQRLRLHAPEMLKEVRWCQTTVQFRSRLVGSHPMFQESTSCARFMSQVEQWMTYADKDKPPCPFNRRRRPPQTIFFVFGKDKDQDRWSVLRFDPQLEKEERIADMEKREDATYSLVGESIFVVGGDTAQQEDSTSVEEFLVAERRWRKRASLAVGRRFHAAAVLTEAGGEALIGVFGGINDEDGCLFSCEVYEVSRDRWFKLPDLREKRQNTAAACLPGDSRVFVFGGHSDPSSPLASVEFCQLRADWRERATSSDFWQPAAPMRTARSGLAATHFRGKIIVAGGGDGGHGGDVHATRCQLSPGPVDRAGRHEGTPLVFRSSHLHRRRHLCSRNELPQRLDNVPIANVADAAVVAANENGCVENSLGHNRVEGAGRRRSRTPPGSR